MVKFLKEQKGLGYRRISHILFTKGYRTVRSKKPIMNNYVYSIYSKGKIRENRIERSFESTLTDLNCFVKYLCVPIKTIGPNYKVVIYQISKQLCSNKM